MIPEDLQWFHGTAVHVLQEPGAQAESGLAPSVFIVPLFFLFLTSWALPLGHSSALCGCPSPYRLASPRPSLW